MAGMDDLFNSLKMFQQGAQHYAIGQGIDEATQHINDINASQMDEMGKRQALEGVSKGLALHLSGLGADATQVAQVAGLTAPHKIENGNDAILEGIMTKSPELQAIGTKAVAAENAPKMDLERLRGSYTLAHAHIMADAAAGRMNAKEAAAYSKDLKGFGTELNINAKARAGNGGRAGQVVNQADRALALLNQSLEQPDGGDTRQNTEAALSVASLLSPTGTPTVDTIKHLLPESVLASKGASLREMLTNAPAGTWNRDFLNRLKITAERERATADAQVKDVQFGVINANAHLRQGHESAFDAMVKGAGIDPSEAANFIQSGKRTSPSAKDVAGNGSGGKIKVSNGKQTFLIDSAHLSDAVKDGYAEVK